MTSLPHEYNREALEQILRDSLAELQTRDLFLLRINVHERALTHRLALHVANRLEHWDVDCEYNRQHDDGNAKVLDEVHSRMIHELRRRPDLLDDEAVTVFPDIIVHRRNSHDNLLVIEVKKEPARLPARELDWLKLKGYVDSSHLRYSHAALVIIPVGDEAGRAADVLWYPPT